MSVCLGMPDIHDSLYLKTENVYKQYLAKQCTSNLGLSQLKLTEIYQFGEIWVYTTQTREPHQTGS